MDDLVKSDAPGTDQLAWRWPDALNALAAAPDHHKVLLENDRVRVLDARIAPGDITPIHTHRWPSVLYVLSWSNFVRYDDKAEVILDSRKVEALSVPPTVLWSVPLPPHTLENVGATELRVISIELKEHPA